LAADGAIEEPLRAASAVVRIKRRESFAGWSRMSLKIRAIRISNDINGRRGWRQLEIGGDLS
jgi:hypothetical protein